MMHRGADTYNQFMTITATLETIETGTIESSTVECQDYASGYSQLQRTLPEGVRMLSVRVER